MPCKTVLMYDLIQKGEGEGEERNADTSDEEQVDKGREPKKVRKTTLVRNRLFEQQKEQGNLQERITVMKKTRQEFQH